MNQTYVHLLITHLPIFGSILGAIVLIYGLWVKSNQTKIAAYILFIISSLGAAIAYLTGEAAEETVENIQGISKTIVEQHEESGLIALIALIVLGVISIISIICQVKKLAVAKSMAFITLVIALISFGLLARTGYMGGEIRYTEINSPPPAGNHSDESD